MPQMTFSESPHEVKCPACGVGNDLSDAIIGSSKGEGHRWTCSTCGALVVIDEIEFNPTITCSLVRSSKAPVVPPAEGDR